MINPIIYGANQTENIVGVHANKYGQATLFIRKNGQVTPRLTRFKHWAILKENLDLPSVDITELDGDLTYRYLAETNTIRDLENITYHYRQTGHTSLYDLAYNKYIYYEHRPEKQLLTAHGITFFKGMNWSDVHSFCFDLETTDLSPKKGVIFAIAMGDNHGFEQVIHINEMSEAELIQTLVDTINKLNPDVIVNHNIYEFDLPFLKHRALENGIALNIGRIGLHWGARDENPLLERTNKEGTRFGTLKVGESTERFRNFDILGRTIIDTLHLVKKDDVAKREMPRYGLKESAIHYGLASETRQYLQGSEIYSTYLKSPGIVLKYALDDVHEVLAISDMLSPTYLELAKIMPLPFQDVITSGTASMIDRLLVREYLRKRHSIPAPEPKTKTPQGALSELKRTGVFHDVFNFDASSLYPSLMIYHKIKPKTDVLNVFVMTLQHLKDLRIDAKEKLKTLEPGTPEYYQVNGTQASVKILINSFFGYMGTAFSQFNDYESFAKVLRTGRETLTRMIEIAENEGAKVIEADTDGIYLTLDDSVHSDTVLDVMNAEFNEVGIIIECDAEFKAMYCHKKKNYVLLNHDGTLKLKGNTFRSRATEPILNQLIQEITLDLLNGNIMMIRKRFVSFCANLEKRNIDTRDLVQTKRTSISIKEYLANKKRVVPHYEACVNSGLLDFQAGTQIPFYKSDTGWKVLSDDRDYDVEHYRKTRIKALAKRFIEAFHKTDFKNLFSLNDIEPSLISKIKTIQTIVVRENLQWIRLMHGISMDKPPVDEWFTVDDVDGITEFCERYDWIDIHRSLLIVHAPETPTKQLGEYRRSGKCLLEIDTKSHGGLSLGFECLTEVMDILRKRFGDSITILPRYNGGHSFHIFVSNLEKIPVYRLNHRHERIFKFVASELSPEHQAMLDSEIYDTSQLIRLEHSIYPTGHTNSEIPVDELNQLTVDDIVELSKIHEPVIGDYDDIAESTNPIYYDMVSDIPDSPIVVTNSSKRKYKARQQAQIVKEVLGDVKAPCVMSIASAIANNDSIGFAARNKIISEMLILGHTESEIVDVFLMNPDPSRYGVLQIDNESENGYRLNQKFAPERITKFDASCYECSEHCNVDACYRSADFLPRPDSPTFDEFRQTSASNLSHAIDNPKWYQSTGIRAIDASLSSGKSYQSMRKALELKENVVILSPTHDACSELIGEIPKITNLEQITIAHNSVIVHVYGQRKESCLDRYFQRYENRGCSQCPKHTEIFPTKDDIAIAIALERRKEIVSECLGFLWDYSGLSALSQKHETCIRTMSRILSTPVDDDVKILAILPHAYLVNSESRHILTNINPQNVFVDEADSLQDAMLSQYQRRYTLMKTRSNMSEQHELDCGERCSTCHLHVVDNMRRGHADVKARLDSVDEYERIQTIDNWMIRSAIKDVMGIDGFRSELFDYEAIENVLKRIESVAQLDSPSEQMPYQYLESILDKLQTAQIDGVHLDCISEPIYIGEKLYRRGAYVATIDVEPVLKPEIEYDTPLMIADVYDGDEGNKIGSLDAGKPIKAFLEFINFCIGARGKIGIHFEIRKSVDDSKVKATKAGIKSCRLVMRYLDIDEYQSVFRWLKNRNTILLSGTFLSHEMLAETLLMRPDEIEYVDVRAQMHRNMIIVHHNPEFGRLAPDNIRLGTFGNDKLVELVKRLVELLPSTKTLVFQRNTADGNILYWGMRHDASNQIFQIENICGDDRLTPKWDSMENRETQSENLFTIDKLRSSGSRAINRKIYDLAIVHGNGYLNWYDYYPFLHAIKQHVNPDTDLMEHIHYNRERSVQQALLRIPRDERLRVCLYLSGDMSHLKYSKDLVGRVVTTNSQLKQLRDRYPDTFIGNRNTQLELLARTITGFIVGKATRDNISGVIEDFEFVGENTGEHRNEDRKTIIDLSQLSPEHKRIVELWCERNETDNAKVVESAIKRLRHIDKLIDEKGFADKSKNDKQGTDSEWKKWLDFLVDVGYLITEKLEGSANRPKIVYKTAQT